MTAPSPASGRSERRANAAAPTKGERLAHKTVEVPLVHGRLGHLGWSVFGLVLGVLLLVKLGTVGQVIGGLLLLLAAYQGYAFVRTVMHEPGTIAVHEERVVLPEGLCRGTAETVPMAEVAHVFFLRRAVPWTSTGPMLVVEAGGRAFTYPRAWFESESDQLRVLRTIRQHLGQESP
ncbi:hypothetical protein [Haliangium ochraceum]|uniref:Uncharacterized protein n=1 Tax=Haliangium ochraceum (strain DSM 14365 / JCM 11303 / SMP-2) TaxID=502025 RepID=D0LYE0_HALO1|nr:hypothetical protein [Haliangium ochraceum]ACY16290.1 hypothetical protein Hoch_3790 [Haliangium ochraceum DSM 14365]